MTPYVTFYVEFVEQKYLVGVVSLILIFLIIDRDGDVIIQVDDVTFLVKNDFFSFCSDVSLLPFRSKVCVLI